MTTFFRDLPAVPVIVQFDRLGAVWSDGKRRTPAEAAAEFNLPNPDEANEPDCLCGFPVQYYENRS